MPGSRFVLRGRYLAVRVILRYSGCFVAFNAALSSCTRCDDGVCHHLASTYDDVCVAVCVYVVSVNLVQVMQVRKVSLEMVRLRTCTIHYLHQM